MLLLLPQSPPTIPTGQAASHVGEKVIVSGNVTAVTISGDTTFIRFGKANFVAIILPTAKGKFKNVERLVPKSVLVQGTVRLVHQRAEIVLDDPEQLQVVV